MRRHAAAARAWLEGDVPRSASGAAPRLSPESRGFERSERCSPLRGQWPPSRQTGAPYTIACKARTILPALLNQRIDLAKLNAGSRHHLREVKWFTFVEQRSNYSDRNSSKPIYAKMSFDRDRSFSEIWRIANDRRARFVAQCVIAWLGSFAARLEAFRRSLIRSNKTDDKGDSRRPQAPVGQAMSAPGGGTDMPRKRANLRCLTPDPALKLRRELRLASLI